MALRKFIWAVCAVVVCGVARAEESAPAAASTIGVKEIVVSCATCRGKGKLVLTPPDKGQYKGKIDAKSHWDVHKECPFCQGHGRRKVYRTRLLPNDETKNVPPCRKCGWAGATPCKKCGATGLVNCRHSNCKDGWIIEKPVQEFRHSSAVKPPKVLMCPECGGIGKVVCPECAGRRGLVCPKCQGLGKEIK